jgi:AcrR family transcriptional regulator
MRAALSAVAEKSFAETTVADIVSRARVSRKDFYQHFTDKRDCFLRAAQDGEQIIFDTLVSAVESTEPGSGLRAAVSVYLQLSAAEPEFVRCFAIEMLATGDAGLRLRQESFNKQAKFLRALADGAGDPTSYLRESADGTDDLLSDPRGMAVIGSLTEIMVAYSVQSRLDELPDIEADVVEIMRQLFSIMPSSQAAAPSLDNRLETPVGE